MSADREFEAGDIITWYDGFTTPFSPKDKASYRDGIHWSHVSKVGEGWYIIGLKEPAKGRGGGALLMTEYR